MSSILEKILGKEKKPKLLKRKQRDNVWHRNPLQTGAYYPSNSVYTVAMKNKKKLEE